jgi:enamidase
VWAMATGNNARTWDLPAGLIEIGRAADLIVMDAPWGSTQETALTALGVGDVPGISAVITQGEVRSLTSRNTPRAARLVSLRPDLPHLAASGH